MGGEAETEGEKEEGKRQGDKIRNRLQQGNGSGWVGTEMRREKNQIKVLETESERERELDKRLKIERIESVNGKGRRGFMEKEEEALCVSGVLLFLFCFFFLL